MNTWQQEFVKKVSTLRDQITEGFDRMADEVIEPVFKEFSDFVAQCDFLSSSPQGQKGVRSYKFSMVENAYVLVFFRFENLDTVTCDYEYFLPGQGRVDGVQSTNPIHAVDTSWIASCFQMALDGFISNYSQVCQGVAAGELVTA